MAAPIKKEELLMKKSDKMFPYLLLAPSALVILFVLIAPLGYSVYCSLYQCTYMRFTKFVGLDNFIKVLTIILCIELFEEIIKHRQFQTFS